MSQAEEAFSALDIELFQTSMDSAVFSVACLVAPLRPMDAARFHRLQGLRQFVAGEEQRAQASFRAARSADPDYTFPASLIPSGHAILDLYALSNPSSQGIPAPVPQGGELWIDGEPAVVWDDQSPALLQVLSDGVVLSSHYMLPGDALPFQVQESAPDAVVLPEEPLLLEPVLPEPDPLTSLTLEPAPQEQAPTLESGLHRLNRPRFFVGMGLGVAALSGWALANQAKQSYLLPQPTWGEAELRRQERITNGLTLGAGAFGLASIGMMGSAVMVMRW